MSCLCGCGLEPKTAAKFLRGHYRRLWPVKLYAEAPRQEGRRVLVHRLRAEKAFGGPLPPRVVVHHADGTRDATAPLVICPDESYHRLLHRRMRVLELGGDPNTDRVCFKCQQPKPLEDFHKDKANRAGHVQYCRPCRNRYVAELRRARLCRP